MVLWARKLSELNFDQLMAVYAEGNEDNARRKYPYLEPSEALRRVEADFRDYLREDFFTQPGAVYCLAELEGTYVSVLRLEPYEDGLLLEALETHPAHRRKGYAKALIRAVQQTLPGQRIYSHVNKRNIASLNTHKACGFHKIKDSVRLLDGTVSAFGVTLVWQSDNEYMR